MNTLYEEIEIILFKMLKSKENPWFLSYALFNGIFKNMIAFQDQTNCVYSTEPELNNHR